MLRLAQNGTTRRATRGGCDARRRRCSSGPWSTPSGWARRSPRRCSAATSATAYRRAMERAESHGHGTRMTLSLATAPPLLSVPWEFLYERPRFLASQRRTPIVRLLETGVLAPPPVIDGAVRILGIVASPHDLAPLDVDWRAPAHRAGAGPDRSAGAGRSWTGSSRRHQAACGWRCATATTTSSTTSGTATSPTTAAA